MFLEEVVAETSSCHGLEARESLMVFCRFHHWLHLSLVQWAAWPHYFAWTRNIPLIRSSLVVSQVLTCCWPTPFVFLTSSCAEVTPPFNQSPPAFFVGEPRNSVAKSSSLWSHPPVLVSRRSYFDCLKSISKWFRFSFWPLKMVTILLRNMVWRKHDKPKGKDLQTVGISREFYCGVEIADCHCFQKLLILLYDL